MDTLASDLLSHLGLQPEPPTRSFLTRVHRAFVTGVTYDTIGIHLGAARLHWIRRQRRGER